MRRREPGLIDGVVKEIGPIDQALGTVVVGQSQNSAVEMMEVEQGIRPAARIVRRRILSQPRRQIGHGLLGMGLGKPVGREKGDIPAIRVFGRKDGLVQRCRSSESASRTMLVRSAA